LYIRVKSPQLQCLYRLLCSRVYVIAQYIGITQTLNKVTYVLPFGNVTSTMLRCSLFTTPVLPRYYKQSKTYNTRTGKVLCNTLL